jgi:hypothetical protein
MAIDFSTSRGCSRRVQPAVYGVLLLPAHIHPAAFLLHHRGRKKLPLCVCERVDVCVVREQSERFSCASLSLSARRPDPLLPCCFCIALILYVPQHCVQFVPPAENMALILLITLRSRETNNAICWRNGFITSVYISVSILTLNCKV